MVSPSPADPGAARMTWKGAMLAGAVMQTGLHFQATDLSSRPAQRRGSRLSHNSCPECGQGLGQCLEILHLPLPPPQFSEPPSFLSHGACPCPDVAPGLLPTSCSTSVHPREEMQAAGVKARQHHGCYSTAAGDRTANSPGLRPVPANPRRPADPFRFIHHESLWTGWSLLS